MASASPAGPAAELWAMADLATPMAIRVAATLRIADHVASGIRATADLAAAVGADPDALGRLLAHLVTAGVLTSDGSDEYVLTGRGGALLDDHPARLRASFDIDSAFGRANLSFVYLLHTVRTGEAAFGQLFGKPFWEDLTDHPALLAALNDDMAESIAADAPAIARCYDWGALESVLDVGGGNGTLLKTILRLHSDLRGAVYERPTTAAAALRLLESARLRGRAGAIAGDFFDSVPPGFGCYLLARVLHDWDGTACLTIMRNCASAARPSGRIVIVERTGAAGERFGTGMDLRMLAHFGGKEHSVDELADLAAESGLAVLSARQGPSLLVMELGFL